MASVQATIRRRAFGQNKRLDMTVIRTYRAGSGIEDYCRVCKTDRMHTVVAADADGRPIRVLCGYCRSEHNYRGGPRVDVDAAEAAQSDEARSASSMRAAPARTADARAPFPLVSERERRGPVIKLPEDPMTDLELLLRRVIREESGLTAAVPAEKWRGGTLVLRPGTPGLQEKSWPIETFFHKVVMLRNRLRTLEQQLNASALPEDVKVKLQAYVSGCYGSLTSFNVLFADDDDQFRGSSE
jgi:hypothetical protein